MGNLTLRSVVERPLTHDELDNNFRYFTGSHAITGSLTATNGFVGNVVGTASYAALALTASYAVSASYCIICYTSTNSKLRYKCSNSIVCNISTNCIICYTSTNSKLRCKCSNGIICSERSNS